MRYATFTIFSLLLLFYSAIGLTQNAKSFIGDQSDGSRAVPVHLIPLLDEEGQELAPDDKPLLPFSVRQTCTNKCHSYDTIHAGWHFNAVLNSNKPGRTGQPWIYADPATGTQIPLSYRNWPGAVNPAEAGLSSWEFVKLFGRQLPGGHFGDAKMPDNSNKSMRWLVSGKPEINCLACHDANPAHDQAEYASQITQENFRWAGAATTGFTAITGSAAKMPDTYDYLMPEPPEDPKIIPPTVSYHPNSFDGKKRVFFDVIRKVPNERCYFCHSTKIVEETIPGKWVADEDVHLMAGLRCTDCHRNGLDHAITRGYAGEIQSSTNALVTVSSCEGCHLGSDTAVKPLAGRFTAPVPKHKGIPLIHFQKMTCTACHSGPWPEKTTHHAKTAQAHGLGNHNVDKSDTAFPHIQTPVFVKNPEGKIEPRNAVWPSYWGVMKDGKVRPIALAIVKQTIPSLPAVKDYTADGWPKYSDEWICQALKAFSNQTKDGKPVFVSAGKVFSLDEKSKLAGADDPVAKPYSWPVAHDIRPAAQSLGARGCTDCHTSEAPFYFATVALDTPVASEQNRTLAMTSFEGCSNTYIESLAYTFLFRGIFKIYLLIAGAILSLAVIAAFVRYYDLIISRLQKNTRQEP